MPTIPAGTIIGTTEIPFDVTFSQFGTGTYSSYDDVQFKNQSATGFICYRDSNTSSNFVLTASSFSDSDTYLVYNNGKNNYGHFARTEYTLDNKTVYWNPNLNLSNYDPSPDSHPSQDITKSGTTELPQAIAWAMVYGGYIDGYNVTYDLTECTGSEENPEKIRPASVVTECNFTANDKFAFTSSSVYIDGTGASEGEPILFTFEPETGLLRIGIVSSDITVHVTAYGDPYQDIDGESDIPGGGSVSIPGLPGLSATSTGIVGLFAPSASLMQALTDYMWTDFGGEGETEVDVLKEVVQAIKRSISNPLDYVTGLSIIPSQGLSIGGSSEVRFGFTNSGVSMPRLTSQYFVVDCGTLSFDTLCGDTFLDYAPYSKFSLYLPYIGVKEMDANDFVGHTIGVVYHGDVVTGGVTAYVTKDGSVMYQFSGCCALNVPLSADSWGTTISGAVQIATSMVAGGIAGGAAGVAESAVKGAASVAANPSQLSPQVAHSGAVSGGAGCMGVQYPFVIREAVRFHSTTGFNTVSGYPSYYFRSLSNVSGYTSVVDVHLTGIPATNAEITEIENILKGGAIF